MKVSCVTKKGLNVQEKKRKDEKKKVSERKSSETPVNETCLRWYSNRVPDLSFHKYRESSIIDTFFQVRRRAERRRQGDVHAEAHVSTRRRTPKRLV